MKKLDYTDEFGVKRRVYVPDNGDSTHADEGIPADFYNHLDSLYADAPESFRVRLYDALWRRGLIEPADMLQPGAIDLYRAAMREVLRADALDVLAKLKENQL